MKKVTKKNKGGRTKIFFTPKQIEEVGELSKSLTIEQIADYMGIGETTFYQIQKRQPEVSIAYKKGKQRAIKWVISKLMEKIELGDTASILFFLKTQAGWREKQQLDINTDSTALLQSIVIKNNYRAKEGDNGNTN